MGSRCCACRRREFARCAGGRGTARADGSTLNQFIVSAVAEKLAALKTADYFAECAVKGDIKAALAMLKRRGGQAPVPGDALRF